MRRLVDSSAWIEWLPDSPLAEATADAIVYATALAHGAELLTCDAHFEGLANVIYIRKG